MTGRSATAARPLFAHPCDAGAALRQFFRHRRGLHDRHTLFAAPAPAPDHNAPALARLDELIASVGHLWGDEARV